MCESSFLVISDIIIFSGCPYPLHWLCLARGDLDADFRDQLLHEAHQNGGSGDGAPAVRDAVHRAGVRDVQGEREGARVRAHAASGAVVAECGAAPQAEDHGELCVHAGQPHAGTMSRTTGGAHSTCSMCTRRSFWLRLKPLLLKWAFSIVCLRASAVVRRVLFFLRALTHALRRRATSRCRTART